MTGLTATAVLAVMPVASAATGDLDTTFGPGHTGTVVTQVGSAGSALAASIARQADGKIIVAGGAGDNDLRKLTLARYNPDGGLDPTFGTGGIVLTPIGKAKSAQANAVVIQADGGILTGGTAVDDGQAMFALARYNNAGVLDPAFGTAGVVLTPFGAGTNAITNALTLQPDGKIVAAGGVTAGAGQAGFAVARYTAAGAIDATFGSGGTVFTPFSSAPGASSAANAVTVAPDGKILTVGSAGINPQSGFALVRYTAAGALDTTFGSGGAVVTSIGSAANAQATSVVLTPTGGIVAGGVAQDKAALKFAFSAYTANGTADPTFGPGGSTLLPLGDGGSAAATALLRQADGKLVAVGTALDGGKRKFAVLRLTPAGAPERTFGSGGSALSPLGAVAIATAAAFQPDGKLLVAGSAGDSANLEFAVARYDLGAGSTS